MSLKLIFESRQVSEYLYQYSLSYLSTSSDEKKISSTSPDFQTVVIIKKHV